MSSRPALSDRFAETAKARAGEVQTEFMESNPHYRGLSLRVTRHGSKSWNFNFTWQGKRARALLGTYPALATADARQRATDARACLNARPPVDPRQHIAAKAAAGMSVAELIEEYAARHMAPRAALPADHPKRLRVRTHNQ